MRGEFSEDRGARTELSFVCLGYVLFDESGQITCGLGLRAILKQIISSA